MNVPIHCARCNNPKCDFEFKLNHKPKKIKLPFLGETMYTLEKVKTCDLVIAKNKFFGISQKQSSTHEQRNGKASKTKLAKKLASESDSEGGDSDIDVDLVDIDFIGAA